MFRKDSILDLVLDCFYFLGKKLEKYYLEDYIQENILVLENIFLRTFSTHITTCVPLLLIWIIDLNLSTLCFFFLFLSYYEWYSCSQICHSPGWFELEIALNLNVNKPDQSVIPKNVMNIEWVFVIQKSPVADKSRSRNGHKWILMRERVPEWHCWLELPKHVSIQLHVSSKTNLLTRVIKRWQLTAERTDRHASSEVWAIRPRSSDQVGPDKQSKRGTINGIRRDQTR